MVVVVSSRHMELTAALKTYAEQKAGKLTHYFDRIQEIEVIFDRHGDAAETRVEIIVTAEHNDKFVAHQDGDVYKGIDSCVDKLERQLSDHKKRLRNRKHITG